MRESMNNQSLLEISEQQIAEFEIASREWMERAWESGAILGEGTDICRGANKHWHSMLSHASPFDPRLTDRYRHALHTAWWAVWRARDYSVDGWFKRYGNDRSTFEKNLGDTVNSTLPHEGVSFPATHFPVEGPNGVLTPKECKEKLASLSQKRVEDLHARVFQQQHEGMVLTGFSKKITIPPDASLRWAYISAYPENLPNLHDCWVAGTDTGTAGVAGKEAVHSVIEVKTISQGQMLNEVTPTKWRNTHFLGGLELQSARTNGDFAFPSSVDCGPGLSILDPRLGDRSLSLTDLAGVHSVRVRAGKMSLSLTNMKLRFFALTGKVDAKDTSDTNLRRVKIQDCAIAAIIAKEVALETFEARDVKFVNSVHLEKCAVKDRLSFTDLSFVDKSNSIETSTAESVVTALRDQPAIWIDENVLLLLWGLRIKDNNVGAIEFDDIDCPSPADMRENICPESFTIRKGVFRSTLDLCELSTSDLRLGSGSVEGKIKVAGDLLCGTRDEIKTPLGKVELFDVEVDGVLSFENRVFGGSTAIERCVLKEAPRFQSAKMNQDTSFRDTLFVWRDSLKSKKGVERNAWLGRTERAFRALAQHMESIKAAQQMSFFHAEQMAARHLRKGDADVARSERWIGKAYQILSGYGGSILRPIVGLFLTWLTAFVSYNLLGRGVLLSWASGIEQHTTLGASMGLASSLMFRPFYHLSPAFSRASATSPGCGAENLCDSSNDLLVHFVSNYEGWFQAIATIQSIASIVLVFLLLLAVRRKFQLG